MPPKDSDQWEKAGDCRICRRKTYCGKACTARKRSLFMYLLEQNKALEGARMEQLRKNKEESYETD